MIKINFKNKPLQTFKTKGVVARKRDYQFHDGKTDSQMLMTS